MKMGRRDEGRGEAKLKKGAWTAEEDQKLIAYIKRYGIWNWTRMAQPAGLRRNGKSCRLRWMNYLRPNIKHGNFTKGEEDTIIKLHQLLGNKWAAIASKLDGRTDNDIKNHWNTRLKKRCEGKSSSQELPANPKARASASSDPKGKSSSQKLPANPEARASASSTTKVNMNFFRSEDGQSFVGATSTSLSDLGGSSEIVPILTGENSSPSSLNQATGVLVHDHGIGKSMLQTDDVQSLWAQTFPVEDRAYMLEDFGATLTDPTSSAASSLHWSWQPQPVYCSSDCFDEDFAIDLWGN